MYHIAIIGAGQLGRRHLEGLIKSNASISIHVVDVYEKSRRAVEEIIINKNGCLLPQIQVYSSIGALPSKLDLAIVATSANERMEVVIELLRSCEIQHLILEKFLFNDSQHYQPATELFDTFGVTAWVNLPRRHFDVYRDLRDHTQKNQLLKFIVKGGDWGMGSSSIHFLDLVQFLTGKTVVDNFHSNFDVGVIYSKRQEYVEFTGEIFGKVGTTNFTLKSIRNSTEPLSIIMEFDQETVLIQENLAKLTRTVHGLDEIVNIRLPYQSEITGEIADQLLSTGSCNLTPYSESVDAHLILLDAFAQHSGDVSDKRVFCAIT